MTGDEHSIGMWAATRGFVVALARHAGRGALGTIALVAAGAVLEGIGIILLVPILTIVLSRGGGVAVAMATFGVRAPAGQLGVLLAGFIALMSLRSLVLYRRDVALMELQTRFIEDLRNRVMTTLAAASWQRVAGLQHARVTNLLGVDIGRIAGSTQLLVQGGVALAMLVVQAGLAIALAPLLAGAVTVVLVAAFATTLARARWARDRGASLVRAHLALMQGTAGFLGGLKAAMAENAQGRFVTEFAAAQAEMGAQQVAYIRVQSRSRARFALASAVAGAGVVWIGVATGITGSVLVALIVLFARMGGPVATIQSTLQNFFFGLPSFEAVRGLEADLGGAGAAPPPARDPPAGAITLIGVGYAHDGGGESGAGGGCGVEAIDLTIAPGEVVGLAGPSGAGKTTLIDILSALIAPQAGEVRVGGVALDETLRAGWRRYVGYVAQDGFLFHDSVRRNLAWSHETDDAALAAALAVTGGDAVVAGLPQGLDTVVGERGARLSGGERQRLAIARALLRRPRLLILDEATNAIDVAGEAELLDRLVALDPRPAVLIVAHRTESLARCDRVLNLASGRLVR